MFRQPRKEQAGASARRWIVLDLETTGLDPDADSILEVGAVAVHDGIIELADRFHRLVSSSTLAKAENRVVHGITVAEQDRGVELATVLDELLAWRAAAPLVGFYTSFDTAFIAAALRRLGRASAARAFAEETIDLALIAPTLFPGVRARGLSQWRRILALPVRRAHRALVDALCTAHLLQRCLAQLPPEKRTFAELKAIERARRWL
ncbi:MAG: 3'-5' exonuclease [Casimicrobiaceae bacterium]|nr:3'-5' exonuclease [Casimicrobiaceae bacterium]MCX8099056.1 3'-5' exonuclease [Casimicrobiaceae bacterium]MDW8312579.1 3'-5' exonuclease [Burkholderiales bacterium]